MRHRRKAPRKPVCVSAATEEISVAQRLEARRARAPARPRGEALGLTWDDVDFAHTQLAIRRSLEESSAGLTLKEPKTARGARTHRSAGGHHGGAARAPRGAARDASARGARLRRRRGRLPRSHRRALVAEQLGDLDTTSPQRTKRGIATIASGETSVLLVAGPALAALVTRYICQRNFRGFAWRLPNLRVLQH